MKRRGNCYVTCEALYHLLGGKKAGYVPHRLKHEGDTHWYLVKNIVEWIDPIVGNRRVKVTRKTVIDPTVSQFKRTPDYSRGIGCGFLTKRPSKRAREMMKRMVWQ